MWLLDLQAESGDPELRARWQRWLDASPDHRQAWQAMESFSARMRQLPPGLGHAALSPGKSRRRALKTLAVLLGAGGSAWLAQESGQLPRFTADLRTGPGERRQVTLADGSLIELNADTALDVDFSAASRRLVLHRGEILITTAPDPAGRPFYVEAPQGRARALGTRYSVRTGSGHGAVFTHVAVYAGAVSIEPRRGSAATEPLVLQAGQQTHFNDLEAAAPTPARPAGVAWTRGILVAEDMPLAAFVEEFSRLTGRSVHCDNTLADLKISGTYPLSDADAALDLLAAALGLRLERRQRWWGRVEARFSPA